MFSYQEPDSSLTWLQEDYRIPALDPGLYLECEDNPPSNNEIRSNFRRLCLEQLQGTMFDTNSLCLPPDLKSWSLALFSYRLTTQQFVTCPTWYGSPCFSSFKEIGTHILRHDQQDHYLLNAQPQDILMTLVPSKTTTLSQNSTEKLRSSSLSAYHKACKFLAVGFMGWEFCHDGLTHQVLIFQVDYCMRRFMVKKRFSDFLTLQTQLIKDTHIFPDMLVKDVLHKLFLGDINHRGSTLATYINDVHRIFANRGCFSPQLMLFLGIDVLKIHREEDCEIIKYLDACSVEFHSSHTPYYLIDASWLSQWKRFIFDESEERLPPGHITNGNMLYFRVASGKHLKLVETADKRAWSRRAPKPSMSSADTRGDLFSYGNWDRFALGCDSAGKLTIKGNYIPKKNLVLGQDYRALSFNSWNYFKWVYKLEPYHLRDHCVKVNQSVMNKTIKSLAAEREYEAQTSSEKKEEKEEEVISACSSSTCLFATSFNTEISRKEEDIYSEKEFGQVHSAVMIQCAARRKLAKMELNQLKALYFFEDNQGGREVYQQECLKKQHEFALLYQTQQEEKRKLKQSNESANYTQQFWGVKQKSADQLADLTTIGDGHTIARLLGAQGHNQEQLIAIKQAQEVHVAYSKDKTEHSVNGHDLVVSHLRDIIKMPPLEVDEFLFTRDMGDLPLGLVKHPHTGKTLIGSHLLPCPPYTVALNQSNEVPRAHDSTMVVPQHESDASGVPATIVEGVSSEKQQEEESDMDDLLDSKHLSKKQILKLQQDKLKSRKNNASKVTSLPNSSNGNCLSAQVKESNNPSTALEDAKKSPSFNRELLLPVIGSEIIEVNDIPVSRMSHEQVLSRLANSSFPLSIQCIFRNHENVSALLMLTQIKNAARLVQEFKKLLQCGLNLKLHHNKHSYPTVLWSDTTHLFWQDYSGTRAASVKKDKPSPIKFDLVDIDAKLPLSTVRMLVGKQKPWKTNLKKLCRLLEALNETRVRLLLAKYPNSFDELSIHLEDYHKVAITLKGMLSIMLKVEITSHVSRSYYELFRVGNKKVGNEYTRFKTEAYCFTLHFKTKGSKEFVLHLEVPKQQQSSFMNMEMLSPHQRKLCRDMIVSCFKKLIFEAMQSQVIVDQVGHVTRRFEPEEEYKVVAGAK